MDPDYRFPPQRFGHCSSSPSTSPGGGDWRTKSKEPRSLSGSSSSLELETRAMGGLQISSDAWKPPPDNINLQYQRQQRLDQQHQHLPGLLSREHLSARPPLRPPSMALSISPDVPSLSRHRETTATDAPGPPQASVHPFSLHGVALYTHPRTRATTETATEAEAEAETVVISPNPFLQSPPPLPPLARFPRRPRLPQTQQKQQNRVLHTEIGPQISTMAQHRPQRHYARSSIGGVSVEEEAEAEAIAPFSFPFSFSPPLAHSLSSSHRRHHPSFSSFPLLPPPLPLPSSPPSPAPSSLLQHPHHDHCAQPPDHLHQQHHRRGQPTRVAMDLPQESRVSPYNPSSQPPRQHQHLHQHQPQQQQQQQHYPLHSQDPHPSSHPSLSSASVTQPSRPVSRPDMYEEDNNDIRDPWPRVPLSSYTSSPGFRHTNPLSRPVYYDRSSYQTNRYDVAPYSDYPQASSSYREPHPSDHRRSRGELPPPMDHHRNGFQPPSYSQPDVSGARSSSAPLRSSNYYPDTRAETMGERSELNQDRQYNERHPQQQQQQQQQHLPRNHIYDNQSQNNRHHNRHQQPYASSNIAPDMLAHNHTTPSNISPFDHFAAKPATLPVPVGPTSTNKGATSISHVDTSTSTAISSQTSASASTSASTMATAVLTSTQIASRMASAALPPSLSLPLSHSLPPMPTEGRERREGREGREGLSQDSATAQVLSDYARPDPGNADIRARDRGHENISLEYHASSCSSQSPARDEPMHPLQPQHQERPPSQQWYRQGMSVSVSVPKRESHDDGDERRYSIDPPRWNDAKYPSYPPSGSGSGSGYLKPSPSYSPSPTTHTRPQNHHVWDGAEPNGSTAHSPSTTPSSIYTPLPYYPSYARSLPSSSQAHPYTPQRPPTIAHPEDYRQQESNLQPNSNLDSHDEDEDEDEDYDDESWQSAKNLGFKFGTDMPTTIDLKAAIDSCETLCKFALHYARQNQVHHPQGHPGPDSLLLEEHERATLQAIRSMSSAMLIGLRNVNNKESDKEGKEGKDKESREGGEDLSESEPVFSPESSVKFGKGAPSDKMVHELAKAATSIFQLAIRIKAWVNMTPEERELDEEINIIRGRRCLVMDGSSSALDQVGHPQTDWAMLQAKSTFHTPMEKRVQHHQESMSKGMDPMEIDRNFGGGEGHSGHISFPGGSGSKAKSKTVAKAGSSSKDEAPPQKYRKRAKRTHPPGRCMSCDSSDTPEWRRGPDGARTLCNACGLHYAKLLKRQNREHKAKQDQQLQFISFPFRKRAKSESPETHRDGFNESDAVKAENDSLEQDPQDTSEPGQQQQQPSPVGQDSETPLAPMGTESVPTITPVPGS